MLPELTPAILQFLIRGSAPDRDFSVIQDAAGTRINRWERAEREPTEQEIADAANDLTTVGGQVFSEWLAEHGGDPALTSRREAREALALADSRIETLLRALALVVMDEINILRAQHGLAPRTGSQIRLAISNKIDSGEADT